ncbi:hypothetical protein AGMMS50293_05810 [Spirochaetia bacterium]|nr:hypothetical protein AGMMS50293_05810 [Spirochaetia bacterium]
MKIPCQFLEASNGKEALWHLHTNKADLILLDWNMPELSGIDFLKQIRSHSDYIQMPIIMVTSEAAKYNVIEALKAGATDYIIKPVSEKSFRDKLSKIRF